MPASTSSQTECPFTTMEIIRASELFHREANGDLHFHCMEGIVRWENKLYIGRWQGRQTIPSDFAELENPMVLEMEDRGPQVKSSWTSAPPDGVYFVKTPDLKAYSVDMESFIRREIETYEALKQHPHPHIVQYHGYREKNGRVSGLCIEQCTLSLGEKVNPRHWNKSAFLSSGRPLVNDLPQLRKQMDGIRSAVAHLHSLGLVHNDINPHNILIAEDGRLLLSDFDSSYRTGKNLDESKRTFTKRTPGWYDPNVSVASEKNDLDALDELQTWLFGSSKQGYKAKYEHDEKDDDEKNDDGKDDDGKDDDGKDDDGKDPKYWVI